MRRARWFAVALVLVGLAGTTGCERSSLEIIPSSATLRLGKAIQFRAVHHAGAAASWSIVEGTSRGIISSEGHYHAPFIAPVDPTATVEVSAGGDSRRAVVTLLDVPPDSGDCYGASQTRLPAPDEIVLLDRPPAALVKVAPAYPDLAREAGVSGTVIVGALVCRTGQVHSTRMIQSIAMLDDAARAAVEQWIYEPPLRAGKPVAAWVEVPVKFSLH